jgi:hypothetical protein
MVEWSMTGVECQQGAYRFTVKDKEADVAWIVAEPAGAPLKIVGTTGDDLHVGFELAAGSTRSDAEALTRTMNKFITHIVRF